MLDRLTIGEKQFYAFAAALALAALAARLGLAGTGMVAAGALALLALTAGACAPSPERGRAFNLLAVPAASLAALVVLPPTVGGLPLRLLMLGATVAAAAWAISRLERDPDAPASSDGGTQALALAIIAAGLVLVVLRTEIAPTTWLALAGALTAFVAGAVTESFFRRHLQGALARVSPRTAIPVCAVTYATLLLVAGSPLYALFSAITGAAAAWWIARRPQDARASATLRGIEYAIAWTR